YTMTASGCSRCMTCSTAINMRPVMSPWLPPWMPSVWAGLAMPSSSKNTSDMLASKCWPVCTTTSSSPAWPAIAADTTLALMNCGRAPRMVRIFLGMGKLGSGEGRAQRRDDLVLGGGIEVGMHGQAHDPRGQHVGHRRGAGAISELGVGRLRVDGARVVHRRGNAGFFQLGLHGVAFRHHDGVLRPDAVAVGPHGDRARASRQVGQQAAVARA